MTSELGLETAKRIAAMKVGDVIEDGDIQWIRMLSLWACDKKTGIVMRVPEDDEA